MLSHGAFIRSERMRRGMRQSDLAEGICTVDTVSRIEKDSQAPSSVLFRLLTERLGVSGFSYGDFFSAGEIRLMKLQRRIVMDLDRGRTEDVPLYLVEYRDAMESASWEEQFFIFAKGWYFFCRTGDAKAFMKSCGQAIELLHPHYNAERDIAGSTFIQNEFRILNAQAVALFELGHRLDAAAQFCRLIVNQKRCEDVLPYRQRNLAILYNNAALCERRLFPREAREHIRCAEKAVLASGNLLMVLRIARTIALYFHSGRDHRRGLMLLRECFWKVNNVLHLYDGFWEFLNESCMLHII